MKQYRIQITELAEKDLEKVADYIAFELKNKIYYIISDDTIYIVRILHMLIDSRAWLYRTFGMDENK